MKENSGRDKLRNILEAIVLENDRNRWLHMSLKLLRNVVKLLHKGLEILGSLILNFMIIFLISSGVGFLFHCFDPSVQPWEAVKSIFLNGKGGKHVF